MTLHCALGINGALQWIGSGARWIAELLFSGDLHSGRVNKAGAFYWKLFDGMHLASYITTGPCIGIFVQRRKAHRIAVCHRGRRHKYDYISSWSSPSSRKRWKLCGNCTESLRWRMLLRSLRSRWEPCHSPCDFFFHLGKRNIYTDVKM